MDGRKIMRTTSAPQQQLRIWTVLVWLLSIVILLAPARAIGDCNTTFDLSKFSFDTVSLVSHSWIDGGRSIRIAPPSPNPNVTVPVLDSRNEDVRGGALYKIPVLLVDPVTNTAKSFNTSFSFSVVSTARVPLAANGLAFIIVPSSASALGYLEPYSDVWVNTTTRTFAVQLNKRAPLITREDGEDVVYSSYLEDAALNFAWIDYDSASLELRVRVSNTSDGPKWVLLSNKYDMSGLFSETMYIGFSSPSKVCVRSWKFVSGCSSFPDAGSAVFTSLPGNVSSKGSNEPKTSSPHGSGSSGTNHRLLIYIGVSCGAALVVCLIVSFGVRKLWRMIKFKGARSLPDRGVQYGPQIFAYRALSLATNDFSPEALLGRGAFGSVYKGILAGDNTVVAVKRIESKNDAQRERQFIAEVASIGRLRHRNLVQLLGWCHEKGQLLLVYDYMPNGSLDRLLFGTQETVLPWEVRYNVLRGVAAGLAFLHGEWEKQVVHRDVKASNVLLDSDLNPRLGDFGLARLIDHNKNPEISSIAGTKGYLAPELAWTGKATDKTDVFSFGALALEIACGRRPIERKVPEDEEVLVDWVWRLHSMGEMSNALDARLQRGQFSVIQVATVLGIGLLCSHPNPAARPTMRQVVLILQGSLECPPVPSSKPQNPRPPPPPPPIPEASAAAGTSSKSSKPFGKTQSRVSDCSAA